MKRYYPWLMALMGMLVLLVSNGLTVTGLTAFDESLLKDFGWTRSRPSAPAPESGYDEPRRPRLDEYESSAERRRREEREERATRRDTYGYGGRQTVAEAAIKSVVRSVSSQVGSQIGRALVRGVLGSLLK